MIKKLNLTDDDYLVIIGDVINKGENSYESLRYVQELSLRDRTSVLKGNHEHSMEIFTSDKGRFSQIYDYCKGDHLETLIDGILVDAGLSIKDFKNSDELFDFINVNYIDVIDYIKSLPIILNFDEFRFVHGGYDDEYCIIEDEAKFLKYDNFNELSKVNDVTTIVGHWPASELRSNILQSVPYYNDEKNIIFIDGGIGVKNSGELNAYIICKKNGAIGHSYLQENNFEKAEIRRIHNFVEEEVVYLGYPHYQFEVVEEKNNLLQCVHTHSKKRFTAFKSLLGQNNGNYYFKANYVNRFFNLSLGGIVEVCDTYDDCVLVKHKDEFGWVLKRQIQ